MEDTVISTDKYELVKSKHTKTDEVIYLLKLKVSLDKTNFNLLRDNIKSVRGYYSAFVSAFVLKAPLSENEINKLFEGVNTKEQSENISSNPEINEAAKSAVNELVDEKGFSKWL